MEKENATLELGDPGEGYEKAQNSRPGLTYILHLPFLLPLVGEGQDEGLYLDQRYSKSSTMI